MHTIKQKYKKDKTIKSLNKKEVVQEKLKNNIIQTKEGNVSESTNSYGVNKIEETTKNIYNKTGKILYSNGKKAVLDTKNNAIKLKNNLKLLREKENKKRNLKRVKKQAKTTTKKTIKNGKRLAKETAKMPRRIIATTKKTIKAVKTLAKALIKIAKAVISGAKALISAIVAGGWIVVVIIVVLCLIGFLFNSVYGIFFSSENTGNKTMSSVIVELNNELADKINNIQNENVHDDYVLNLKRPEWKDVLSVYAVVVSSGKNGSDVMTITEEKTVILKEIFWKMNELSYYVADELDDNGNTKKMLYININSKTVEEMINEYALNNEQQKQLNELLDDKYESLWSNVVYGNSTGNSNVVDVALSQVGNKGGEPYWRWYGFNSRIEWCAVFVSWVYNQVGELNISVPKFSTCHTQGVPWFKTLGLWKDKGYVPKAGDVIFFDWEQDGHTDHVGIVETSDGKEVYTIEGNSRDEVKRKKYKIDSKYIYGYGIPKH